MCLLLRRNKKNVTIIYRIEGDIVRRVFRKFNKRTVSTFILMFVVFVMSLGYAALSQYIEIDGVALIDRTWDIKVTEVTSKVSGSGQSVSNPYVGSTVTMNANVNNSSSSVTYTITLENKGNVRAKLHSIEKITDNNSNITYTVSGVEEGVTLLEPGETNTVTVVISYASGVTSTSNTSKSVMLSFNYIEDTTSNGPGGTTVTYEEYPAGAKVEFVDGSTWTVVEDSGPTEEYITLFADAQMEVSTFFDSTGSTLYNPASETNIGYVINNEILPELRELIENVGGDAAGLSVRLISNIEITRLSQLDYTWVNQDMLTYDTWTMTESGTNEIYYLSGGEVTSKSTTSTGLIRPVIIVKKSNVSVFEEESGPTLSELILSVYEAQSDENIDFSKTSEGCYTDTNYATVCDDSKVTNGLYYTSTNTENNQISYYFRGEVDNNYVQFGNHYQDIYYSYDLYGTMSVFNNLSDCQNSNYNKNCTKIRGAGDSILWRIIRINEDGSIRLITQDSVGESAFNSNAGDNAYVGYMYGSTGQSGNNAYNLTHSNDNPSTIKTYLDNWYVNNLSSYAGYLADAGFCNDRSVAPSAGLWNSIDTALGYGRNRTYYGAYNRLVNEYQPQFKCSNEGRDLFTTSGSTKGNKELTNPIGLITADELAYAGAVYFEANESMYLTNGKDFWTMSPFRFPGRSASVGYFDSDGYLGHNVEITSGLDVRPVINLRSGVEIMGGDGTVGTPYIIKTN